jgi:hypothetical protein
MRSLVRACLVALPLLATPSLARAWCLPPTKVDCGVNCHLNGYIGNWNMAAQLGPWYLYWPYNAHFQTPAPVGGWPYWPAAVAAVPAGQGAPPSGQMPKVEPTFFPSGGFQPTGYSVQAPSYWYGR